MRDPSPLTTPSNENHNEALQRCICEITTTWAPFDCEGVGEILVIGQKSPGPVCMVCPQPHL